MCARPKGTVRVPNERITFYDKLVGDLEAHGFKINPFDPCVANKIVGRKKLTITWTVDNLKIFHVNKKVVLDTIVWLE